MDQLRAVSTGVDIDITRAQTVCLMVYSFFFFFNKPIRSQKHLQKVKLETLCFKSQVLLFTKQQK